MENLKVRVDRNVWLNARRLAGFGVNPKVTDAEISRMLYHTSLFNLENKVGRTLNGKRTWEEHLEHRGRDRKRKRNDVF